jgi:hypothetical protein
LMHRLVQRRRDCGDGERRERKGEEAKTGNAPDEAERVGGGLASCVVLCLLLVCLTGGVGEEEPGREVRGEKERSRVDLSHSSLLVLFPLEPL